MVTLKGHFTTAGKSFYLVVVEMQNNSIVFKQQHVPVFIVSGVKLVQVLDNFKGPDFKAS